uniref:Uncharacterized protein n=1 Tax=Panagrolaimus sp. ES5 TaxID=591445 RepID=A0AC34FWE4_9BILA
MDDQDFVTCPEPEKRSPVKEDDAASSKSTSSSSHSSNASWSPSKMPRSPQKQSSECLQAPATTIFPPWIDGLRTFTVKPDKKVVALDSFPTLSPAAENDGDMDSDEFNSDNESEMEENDETQKCRGPVNPPDDDEEPEYTDDEDEINGMNQFVSLGFVER